MSNDVALRRNFERDRGVWDSCAAVYEREIVHGHPDVLAYEAFEEDLLDRLLCFLAEDSSAPLHLVDIGCGSGRLQVRYGLKTTREDSLPSAERATVGGIRRMLREFEYDPLLAGTVGSKPAGKTGARRSWRGLEIVEGVDFSGEMIKLAGHKLSEAGLGPLVGARLMLRQGSAFELQPMAPERLPVVVTVCNSIGVMQGPEGAQELFKALRRAVEPAGGVAMISAYRKEAVASHALGNYESTMNVSGQPRWLAPEMYAREGFVLVPRQYKRAWDANKSIVVDVYDGAGQPVRAGLVLTRVDCGVEQTVDTGHIRTWGEYESYWYGFDRMARWIEAYWGAGSSWHLAGVDLDALRGYPAQIAIYDPRRRLVGLMNRWRA